jgi:hypothetical protein
MRLPIFLFATAHDTTSLTPTNSVWKRTPPALWPAIGGPHDKEWPTSNHMDWLHNIHNYNHQHLKLASDRKKTHYNFPANSAVTRRVAKCACITQPPLKENHPSFNPHGRAQQSPKSMMWCTWFSNTLERWWLTSTLPGNHSRWAALIKHQLENSETWSMTTKNQTLLILEQEVSRPVWHCVAIHKCNYRQVTRIQ